MSNAVSAVENELHETEARLAACIEDGMLIDQDSTKLTEMRRILRNNWKLSFSNSNNGKKEIRTIFSEQVKRPLEDHVSKLTARLSELRIAEDEQGAVDQEADDQGADDQGADEQGADDQGADEQGADEQEADEQEADNQGVEEHESPVVKIKSLIVELKKVADEIDLAGFLGSQSRREQEFFKDSETRASELMQTSIRVDAVPIDLHSIVLVLALLKPCVLLPSCVAVLRSHDCGVTGLPINHYVRHYARREGPNAGGHRSLWALLRTDNKE